MELRSSLQDTKPTISFEDLTIVGIGSSAGGLEACRNLIRHLPNGPVCYILCQHLSPNHESMLCEILSRDTQLKVEQIQNKGAIQAGHFYIAPPNTDLTIDKTHFVLSRPPKGAMPKPNINMFFDSLADAKASKAIALILSGSGSDGALGVTRIKSLGGVVLVQTPESSQYDGMPRAAIATHVADYIEDAEKLALKLHNLIALGDQIPQKFDNEPKDYQKVLQLVSDCTNIDFFHYKRSTISRRLARRMSMSGCHSLQDYCKLLADNEAEVWAFVRDAFISVSQFYRDPEAFDMLKKQFEEQLSSFPSAEEFRIWVPACATGDEAYTISMIMEDIASERQEKINYKILATDVATKTIAFARDSLYEEDKLVNIPERWRQHYFEKAGSQLMVKRFIRDRVVFSVHNILSDPPFSRLDCISCRNLLIYFDEKLQNELVKLFHFSLNTNGVLLLGASELVRQPDLFDSFDQKTPIYKKNPNTQIRPNIPPFILRSNIDLSVKQQSENNKNDELRVYKSLCNIYTPPLIIVNENNTIVFCHGNYRTLLSESSGLVKNDFFDSVTPGLRAEYRALLYKSRRTLERTTGSTLNSLTGNEEQATQLVVQPLGSEFPGWSCLTYSIIDKSIAENGSGSLHSEEASDIQFLELEQELNATRENLQTVVEELETANEQLQIYNEELQSSNEEYQSTNEELQTVNEELQSTNEELLTVNDEYAAKTIEQTRISSDLSNIQESIELPLFLISTEYRIKRFTRSCESIVDINKIKIDDFIFAIQWHSNITDLKPLIETVETTGRSIRERLNIAGRHYHCQVSPYINSQKKLDGYTIIFYDTTNFERAQEDLLNQKMIAQTTLETINEGVIRLNPLLVIEFANSAAIKILEWDRDDLIGRNIGQRFKIFDEESDINIKDIVNRCINNDECYHADSVPITLKRKFGSEVTIELSISPMEKTKGAATGAVIAFRDVSERHSQLKTLVWRSKHDPLTGLVNRHEMERRIDQSILIAKRDHVVSSFLYLDLDQFKVINDTCGHLAGDQLLKQLAELMTEMLRSRDTLARLGGDEFAILLDRCPLIEAESIAIKLQKSISHYRYSWEDKAFRVGVSIGIVSISERANQVAEILSDADAACYAAKESGRNCIQIHSNDNEVLETQRLQMRSISDINEAIEEGSFRLYFQEIRPVDNTHESSWEVLLRMFNRKGEFLLAERFLPAAERFGLISRIDFWVLEKTLSSLSTFINNKQQKFPRVSINISASTIGDESYLSTLKRLIEKYSINPSCLSFELTETSTMSNYVKARAFMNKIREIGCRFSLDDFGTGMSSLSYLRDLSIDTVKIDRSFIENICCDEVKSAIVKAVNEVAHLLSLDVVAEGVEQAEQLKVLTDLGVDLVQGFYVDKPVPFEEFIAKVIQN